MHAGYMSRILHDYRINDKKLRIKRKRDTFRRSIEKKFRCVVEKEDNLLNEFPELSPHQITTILNFFSDISSIVGLYFENLWYVNEKNVLYNGHVVCVKPFTKSKIPKAIEPTGKLMKLKKMGRMS